MVTVKYPEQPCRRCGAMFYPKKSDHYYDKRSCQMADANDRVGQPMTHAGKVLNQQKRDAANWNTNSAQGWYKMEGHVTSSQQETLEQHVLRLIETSEVSVAGSREEVRQLGRERLARHIAAGLEVEQDAQPVFGQGAVQELVRELDLQWQTIHNVYQHANYGWVGYQTCQAGQCSRIRAVLAKHKRPFEDFTLQDAAEDALREQEETK